MADWRLILGDYLEAMATLGARSVDIVLTDPPYATKFLHLWEPLARESARVLKDGGLLLTLAGHFALDRIIPAMSRHLKYHWIGGMPNTAGTVARNFSRQIMCGWKPVLWFAKGKIPDHPFVFDLFQAKRVDRVHHKWEQPAEWFAYYIEKLTAPGGLVLDPFMGSGSTGVPCLRCERRFIGIEKDPVYHAIALKRLAGVDGPLFADPAPEDTEGA